MQRINANFGTNVSKVSFGEPIKVSASQPQAPASQPDAVDLSTKKEVAPPKISRMRLAFSVLTNDQVKAINESGKLPENAKFVMNGFGGYTICNNFFGFRAGTRTLPEGFEVKKTIYGTAAVLPKDMDGAIIRK